MRNAIVTISALVLILGVAPRRKEVRHAVLLPANGAIDNDDLFR